MERRKRCINCKEFEKSLAPGGIGFCKMYGLTVKDTLCGCALKAITEERCNAYGEVVWMRTRRCDCEEVK